MWRAEGNPVESARSIPSGGRRLVSVPQESEVLVSMQDMSEPDEEAFVQVRVLSPELFEFRWRPGSKGLRRF